MSLDVMEHQSSLEKLIFPIDWSPSLLENTDITSVIITHTPPASGSPATFGQQIETPISYIKSPEGLDVGLHRVSVVAITSNPDLKPEVVLVIRVFR